MPILISAQIEVPAEKREKALKDAKPLIAAALAERGCIHYDWSLDPNSPTRINVYEEWSDEAALAEHFEGAPYKQMRDHLGSAGITGSTAHKYRCDLKEPVYDANFMPQARFAGAARKA